jgi:hypothetical protein
LSDTPGEDTPIACSLPAAALGDREAEWRTLLDSPLVRREGIPFGVRLTVQPAYSGELRRLIDLERSCCAWMQFDFDGPETVAITAPGEGADVLVAMLLDRETPG